MPICRALLRSVFFVTVLSLVALPASADFVEVQRNANLYAQPDSHSQAIEHYEPADGSQPIRLTIVEPSLRSGYYRVETANGQRGWIYRSRVKKFAGAIPGVAGLGTTGIPQAIPGGFPVDSATGDEMLRVTNIGYVAGYSETKWNPLWVAHRIGTNRPHQCPRLKRFRTDTRSEARVTHDDYNNSGYDRGHMAPSATIGHEFGCEAQDGFFKIVLRNKNGQLDALAILMQQDTAPGTPIRDLVTTIDEVERLTGLDFFAELPDATETLLESMQAADNDWQLGTALDTTFEGTPRALCVKAPMPRENPVDG